MLSFFSLLSASETDTLDSFDATLTAAHQAWRDGDAGDAIRLAEMALAIVDGRWIVEARIARNVARVYRDAIGAEH